MHQYKHFIQENISPVGARKISVYNSKNERVGSIALGTLSPSLYEKDRLYSFCALADIHIQEDKHPTSTTDFQRALSYANKNCDFTVIAGDLTENATIENELADYKSLVEAYAGEKPVYAIAGNHENYSWTCKNYLETYTGTPLYYSFTKKQDIFIMVGHYGAYEEGKGWLSSEFISQEELQWLYETLEENRNKRCFVFIHALPHEHGVGNPCNLYALSGRPLLWYTQDGNIGQSLISLLKHYKNTILFHGHTHTCFRLQELDQKANYSNANGYRSVHIPSLAEPRDWKNGALEKETAESEGYIVDVYKDCIVLNGRDFGRYDDHIQTYKEGKWLPIAIYKIDTHLQTIPENTFSDPTGIIKNTKNS